MARYTHLFSAPRRARVGIPRSRAVCYRTAMTLPFSQRFLALAKERSPLCVGVDPSAEALKEWGVPADAAGRRDFCPRLAETCAPPAASGKPRPAVFGGLGPAGLE